MTTIIENTSVDNHLNIDNLTEASLTGNGVFDVLLHTLRLHLDREHAANRLTGTAYATVYSECLQAFLAQAIQYTLAQSKLALELKTMEAQLAQIEAQTAQTNYTTNYVLPKQVEQTEAQINKILTETALVIKQGQLTDAQVCEVKAQTNKINYEVAKKIPEEIEVLKRNNELLTYDLNKIKPKELALKEAQVALGNKQVDIANKELSIKTYELQYKLPAEVGSIQAQTSLYQQKVTTESANTDGSVITAGSLYDFQNKMAQAQIDGFKRDAEQKATSAILDTWMLQHNTDPDNVYMNATNKLTDNTVGATVTKLLNGIGVTV